MNLIIDTSPPNRSIPPGSAAANGTNQGAGTQRGDKGAESQAGVSQDFESYRVTISEEALRKAGLLKDMPSTEEKPQAAAGKQSSAVKGDTPPTSAQDTLALTNLKRIDRDVRAHEQAHIAVGGSLIQGGASFGYTAGSDGRLYAVSGEVSIDTSPVRDDPEATAQKMMRVVAAAQAPSQPSGQDRAVASAAMKMEMEARQQIAQKRVEKMQGGSTSETESEPVVKPPGGPQTGSTPKQGPFQGKRFDLQA